MKKRIFSMLIAICMIFSSTPMSVLAQANNIVIINGVSTVLNDGGTSVIINGNTVCPHIEHSDACGFKEAVAYVAAAASVPCNQNCTQLGADNSIIHLMGCAYKPSVAEIPAANGVPCTHTCKLCKPEEETLPLVLECNCTVKCTAADGETAVINKECPVCGAEKADLMACTVKSKKP